MNKTALRRNKTSSPWSHVLIVVGMFAVTLGLLIRLGVVSLRPPNFKNVEQAARSVADLKTMVPADAGALRKAFGLSEREIVEMVYYAPKSSMDASELLVLRVKDPAKLSAYQARIENNRNQKAEMFRAYRPAQTEILKQSVLRIEGPYLIYLCGQNVQQMDQAITAGFR
ncbi:hypothetical protein ABB02_01435 [Clostridiaceae bacterium JG1575]|nr:hypothetical protein ABB02_01435 [Clostridiaceae bacterium JG1575]